MDKCDACQPGRLCDEHLERDYQRMKGVVARRADEYIATPRARRPSSEELRLEAAHRVRDLTIDARLRERFAGEFIMWLAMKTVKGRG